MTTELSNYQEAEESGLDLGDYWAILKRRRYQFLVPAAIISLLSLLLAFGLPAVYRSTATILIEEQEIPRELVKSTITNYAAQQIQVITQRVMTTSNINRIVEQYGLYEQKDGSNRLRGSQLIEQFRKDVILDLQSADVIDPRSGRPTQATIAFTLSFDNSNPAAAQKVASELVDMYLAENLRTRAVQAEGASEFLMGEARALNAELQAKEAEIAKFKEANQGGLPELYQFNLSAAERSQRDISEVNLRMQELEKRQIELVSKLSQMDRYADGAGQQGTMSDAERLRMLKSEYRKKSAVYRENHPDLVRLKSEIASLQASGNIVETRSDIAEELQIEKGVLAELKRTYTPDHPKVVSAERVVANLEQKMASAPASGSLEQNAADNPAYLLLDSQLNATRSEMRSLAAKKAELQLSLDQYEQLIHKSPVVEQAYSALLRDYDTAKIKYQEIKAKQREADVSKSLEEDRKGERFTVVEPPSLPTVPNSPNRLAIGFLGLVLAMGSGLGMVVLRESVDSGIRGEKALTAIMGSAPLAVIPYLRNADDKRRASRELRLLLVLMGAVLLAVLVAVHVFYQPLDVLWFQALEKFGIE